MLSEQDINKFKKIYHKQYGIRLSKQEAFEKASQLINLFKAIRPTQPNGDAHYENL